jgi:organic hydroperoxide reductase OsmC/OhrA
MAEHMATVVWQRGEQAFTDDAYSRGHEWRFDGGAVVAASASPAVVPLPMAVAGNVDPEEAFVAALASCHMLFFLSIAAKRGYLIDGYTDVALGHTGKNEEGKLAVTKVVLEPRISFSGEKVPTAEQVRQMHERSHDLCFIANSVKTEVIVRSSL